MEYEVRIKGVLAPDLDVGLASRQFAKVFKTDVNRAQQIITSGKVTSLKKNLSRERAEKMLAVLTKIGLKAAIYPKVIEEVELSLVVEPELDLQPNELSLVPEPDLEASSEVPSEAPSIARQSTAESNPQDNAALALSSPTTDSPKAASPKVGPPKKPVREQETAAIEAEDDEDQIPEINIVPVANGFTWISAGFKLMKQHPIAWIVASLVAVLINGAVSAIPAAGPFLSMAIWPVLFGGLMMGAHKQAQGQSFSGLSFLNGLGPHTVQLMLVGAAYLLFYGLLMGAMIGTFMLLGDELSATTIFIVVSSASFPPLMILFFAPTLVVVNNLSAFQACKLSLMGGLKNALPFILFNAGLIGILILGAIALGVGILVSLPIAVASMYAAYCDIFD